MDLQTPVYFPVHSLMPLTMLLDPLPLVDWPLLVD
jgi:hypothetical protein